MDDAGGCGRTPGEPPWEALTALGGLPDLEVERLRRIDAASRLRADASHPPTHLRMAAVRGTRWTEASYRLGPKSADAVDHELGRARRFFHDEVEDRFLHS